MFKEPHRRLNSTSLKSNSRSQVIHMLPTTTTTDDAKFSCVNLRSFTRKASNITVERSYFLLIHLFLYIIIFIIICIRYGQLNNKQEKILAVLNSNHNLTFHQQYPTRLLNHN
jgi:hypothetical protein